MADPFGIENSIDQINEIIQKQYPLILSDIAKQIFASKGHALGRSWTPNTAKTIKAKGGDSPNVETGQLEEWLETPGNLENDNYMANLPTPKRTKRQSNKPHQTDYSFTNNYEYANTLRPFDDIGRTPEDEEYIEQKLEQKIAEELGGR